MPLLIDILASGDEVVVKWKWIPLKPRWSFLHVSFIWVSLLTSILR